MLKVELIFGQFNFFSYLCAMNTELMIKRIQRLRLTADLETEDGIKHFHHGHEYVEIGGIKWATMNVGADKVIDSGLYFAWGETQGYTVDQVSGNTLLHKHFGWCDGNGNGYIFTPNGIDLDDATNLGITKYNKTDDLATLEKSDDAVTAAWGDSWKIPTIEEFKKLSAAVNTAWTTDYQGSGVSGLVCTDKTNSSKVLFFPAAGICSYGVVHHIGFLRFLLEQFCISSCVRCL